MFAHFRDMVESRGGSRWWNTNFAEHAHVKTCKLAYRAGNKQVATIQTQLAANYERSVVVHRVAIRLGVDQDAVRSPGAHARSRALQLVCSAVPLRGGAWRRQL